MLIKEEYLITINSRNRIQRVRLRLTQNPYTHIFTIERISGQYGGKEIDQPSIDIDKGKVKRTAAEQAMLQYNSLLKNYLDKGYLKLSGLTKKQYAELSEEEMKNLIGSKLVKDQSGIPKPMLAKLSDQCSSNIWEKEWIVSRKLNGVRCMLYYRNGEVHSASRGGGTYDVGTKHIRENAVVREIFRQNPDLILDGELYHHGVDWPLQRISGLARQQEWKDECGELEYWVYDYIDTNKAFRDRWKMLQQLKAVIPADNPVKILEQKSMTGYLSIKKEHDRYVKEGFEGLCARNPDKSYGVNCRSANYLIKMKERKDDEATIIDVKEGLRPEDMCFILKTKDGIVFAAKPIGDTETRTNYLKNKEEFIGKQMTYTYFELSKDGVPCQPVAVHIRPDDE